jgi:hypothetical protein
MEDGLQQVLKVLRLVYQSNMNRITAVMHVEEQHRVPQHTVTSACRRGLYLHSIREFDAFCARENAEECCQRLVRRFPHEQNAIEDFFASVVGWPPPSSTEDPMRIVKTLLPRELKPARDALLLGVIRDPLARWLDRIDLPCDIKREIRTLREQL